MEVSSTKVKCTHDELVIRVLESVATCEKTAVFCRTCSKQLTEAKTEC